MKKMMPKILSVFFVLTGSVSNVYSQCANWLNSPQKDVIEEAHVLYRQFVKAEEYDKAFEYWQKAYTAAPAADGSRSYHFSDGRKIYLNKLKNETNEAKKKEYIDVILRLYKEQFQCYPNEKANAAGLKVYDMFYVLNMPYDDTKSACREAVDAGGMNTNYVVFMPYASIAVFQYKNNQMQAEEARNIYLKLNEIADHNIANNKNFSAYYKQAKDAMNGTFAQIENQIFDCEYFKKKFEPEYRAKSDDTELLKFIYNRLIQQGCVETDAFVLELKSRYEEVVAAENAAKLEEYYKTNPGDHGIALFKEGKFNQALAKFEEGIVKEKAGASDNEKLANYHFYIASIQFRQFDRYGAARDNARTAARYKSNWGQPYLLIGDMYAATSNSCGNDAFDRHLAVIAAIDKYAYARSIDSEVASEASSKIGRYSAYLPDKEDGHMRGIAEGASMTVPCWIGETVRVRFK
jgi:hypothetical protein